MSAEKEPAHDHLTYSDLLRIVELIKSTEHFSEFRLKVGEIEVELRRRRSSPPPAMAAARIEDVASARTEPNATPTAPREVATWPEDSIVITSPMIGTFYRSPKPGVAPFVEVDARVEPETIVCIIEVMKLMNSVPAGVRGTVTHVLIDDAASVQAGQALIVVRPE
ncbi:MAG: acetyl-CoA carboxylase biotin carboxyl carrier protein [Burkholderiaceae bacterium]